MDQTNAPATSEDATSADVPLKTENGVKSRWAEEEASRIFDDRDKGTPDEWIPRHPALIRLTGRHPFNAEPPLSKLVEIGLQTPSSLHYVRNHGKVPKLDWNTHKLIVGGLVKYPREFQMSELLRMPSLRILVTMSCDGNRRKEINTIKPSIGFHWGAGAVSTAYWTGVPLHILLKSCEITADYSKSYVWFDGPEDGESLPHGRYGTSIPLSVAMDPLNDIILAYQMNDAPLPPDHGYPLRLIIPGYVGGRQVKWLSKITVTDKESDSWWHWHDNKVLPPNVEDAAQAEHTRIIYDPRYTIYEMNVNSVITHPDHEEWVHLHKLAKDEYTIRGYAYSGGGRSISVVEVSFDGGITWDLADIEYPPDYLRHGCKCWMWCHWSIRVPMWRFLTSHEVVVRARDSSFNTQPEHPTWNLKGMMNNCWYRVKVEIETPRSEPTFVVFKHPVRPGSMAGGWMVKPEQEPRPVRAAFPVGGLALGTFSKEEVQKHSTENDCFVIMDGKVYDLTSYLSEHPGGKCPILAYAGQDATSAFHQIHDPFQFDAKEMFCIGTLVRPYPDLQYDPNREALNPKRWIEVSLKEKREITRDTRRFVFQIEDKNKSLGIPVGQHVLLSADIDGHTVVRPYTPIRPASRAEFDDTMEFVIKIYFPKGNRPGGVMTTYLEKMKIGDKIRMKGPAGHIIYHQNGVFSINGITFKAKKLSLLAGGSGITPHFQLLRSVVQNPQDDTEVALIAAYNSPKDVLLKKELDELAKHKNIKVWYTVSEVPEGEEWQHSIGRIDEHMMRDHIFMPSDDTLAFVCGPPPMIEHSCLPNLEKLGYTIHNIVLF